MEATVYLDYAATTPLDKRVWAAMQPYFSVEFGNPSSLHRYGQKAEAAVESAREDVARALHCTPSEIIFTSCGTESDNLAIRGAALAGKLRSGATRLFSSRTEHHAVTKTIEQLEKVHGFRAEWFSPDSTGRVHADSFRSALGPDCAIVSLMYANNEIGTINPVMEFAAACRASGSPLHTDAVQAAAYLPLDVEALGVDLMSLGGHKFYGPKGIGVLYVRANTQLLPTQSGGSQESGRRAGTHNVPLIVGFAKALQLAQAERAERIALVQPLRDRIIERVLEAIPDSRLTGSRQERLPNHASFVFRGVDGNLLLALLDAAGFACSSGSACKTGNPEPSEVLTSMGLPREWSLGSLRVTLGTASTLAEVESFLASLPALVDRARKLRQPVPPGGTERRHA
jgi:cysteine desulfurase